MTMPNLNPLLAISPLDGRYQENLKNLGPIVSEYGLIHYRYQVELAWLSQLIHTPHIDMGPIDKKRCLEKLKILNTTFDISTAEKVKTQEKTTAHDIKAVEYTLRAQFENDSDLKPLIPWIHFACTSADINNIAYALMIKDAVKHSMLPYLKCAMNSLRNLAQATKNMAMLSHTHGQAASPTTMGKEITNFIARLQRIENNLSSLPILAKCNGAVGNYNAHQVVYPEIDWIKLSKQFIESFGLQWQSHSTQIEPGDHIAYTMQTISRLMTITIDLTRDIWAYISLGYFKQALKTDEVGSSTMPHKINPIHFENAEGNAGIARALATHLAEKLPISRLQRDLSGSTVMRNVGTVFAYCQLTLTSLNKGISRLSPDADTMLHTCQKQYALLAEPIQMMMRRYGIMDAYEQLKALTRGKADITKPDVDAFITTLAIPDEAKARLLQLQPSHYIGLAAKLVDPLE